MVPSVATGEFGLSNQHHVLEILSFRMTAPSRRRDPAFFEELTRTTFSLHQNDCPPRRFEGINAGLFNLAPDANCVFVSIPRS